MVYGLRAQSPKYDRDQGSGKGSGLRRMGSGITRLLSPNQGSDLLHGLKISYLNIFPLNKVCVHIISWPRYITYTLLPAGGSSCHTKSWLFDENIVSYS